MTAVIFVDAQNLFNGGKEYGEEKGIDEYLCDVEELKQLFSEDYDISRAFWFDAFDPRSDDDGKMKFFHKVEDAGYQVIKRPLQYRSEKRIVKGVDTALVTKLLSLMHKDVYDTAILVSGDDDFRPAVEEIQDFGKDVVVASFKSRLHSDLKRQADECIILDEYGDKLQL